jgi:hypothetical protein
MYAIFDSNKEFISYGAQPLNGPFFSKELPDEKSDFLQWRWVGNYDTGEMVKLEENPYENILNEKFFQDKYPFDIFNSIILKQLFITSKQNKTCQLEFETLIKDYIECFENNETYLNLLKFCNKK